MLRGTLMRGEGLRTARHQGGMTDLEPAAPSKGRPEHAVQKRATQAIAKVILGGGLVLAAAATAALSWATGLSFGAVVSTARDAVLGDVVNLAALWWLAGKAAGPRPRGWRRWFRSTCFGLAVLSESLKALELAGWFTGLLPSLWWPVVFCAAALQARPGQRARTLMFACAAATASASVVARVLIALAEHDVAIPAGPYLGALVGTLWMGVLLVWFHQRTALHLADPAEVWDELPTLRQGGGRLILDDSAAPLEVHLILPLALGPQEFQLDAGPGQGIRDAVLATVVHVASGSLGEAEPALAAQREAVVELFSGPGQVSLTHQELTVVWPFGYDWRDHLESVRRQGEVAQELARAWSPRQLEA